MMRWNIGSFLATFIAVICGFIGWTHAQTTSQVASTQSSGITPSDDWPAFLGPTGDSKSREVGFDFHWPASGLSVRWSRELGASYGIGAVSAGKYYQFDYSPTGQPLLLCLDRETGKRLWEFTYTSTYEDLYNYAPGPRTSPVVDGERIYVYGVEGVLHCVNANTGEVIWKNDTAKTFGVVQNFFGVGSTPIVSGDLLIVMVGGSPADDQQVPPGQLDRVSGNGSGIVAFDKSTGEVRYQLSDELASYAGLKLVKSAERAWCFAFMRGGLLAFNPDTGQEDFRFPWRASVLESVNASTPVVWDNHVFISETYGPGAALLNFRPGGFELVWSDADRRREKSMQTHWNTPIYHAGYLYGCSGRHTQNAELRCIEALSGKVMWSEPGTTRLSMLFLDGHFIALDEYGTLRVFRATPARYEKIAEWQPVDSEGSRPLLKYPAWAAPIVSHGLMYVRGKDRLVCYELPRR